MDMQMIAGAISSMMFATGTLQMLHKAYTTKDLHSYSLWNIVFNNIGNVIHWVYILSLPFGPIYLLHGFFTLSTLLMLIWFFYYGAHKTQADKGQRATQTLTMPTILRTTDSQLTPVVDVH